jgi:hypothetical protein
MSWRIHARSVGFLWGMPTRVLFGDCVFDTETRELTRLGQPVHISPKAFRLLELLSRSAARRKRSDSPAHFRRTHQQMT